jgi:agmatinase
MYRKHLIVSFAIMKYLAAAAALVGTTYAHGHHDDQTPIEGPLQGLWYNSLPGDGGTQVCLVASLAS